VLSHRLHDIHSDGAMTLRKLLSGFDFTIKGNQISLIDLVAVTTMLGLFFKIRMMMAQIDTGDRTDTIFTGNSTCKPVSRDPNPHSALYDRYEFFTKNI
jgi:hypothetical protein